MPGAKLVSGNRGGSEGKHPCRKHARQPGYTKRHSRLGGGDVVHLHYMGLEGGKMGRKIKRVGNDSGKSHQDLHAQTATGASRPETGMAITCLSRI
jgi:hypothetical protein